MFKHPFIGLLISVLKYKSRRREEAPSQEILQHCQTSLAHLLCDHFCLQRGPQRPVRHTQDNDNKPAIKAFKIQLELTPSNTFPAVLTHLGWAGHWNLGRVSLVSNNLPFIFIATQGQKTQQFLSCDSFSASTIRYFSTLHWSVSC